MDVCLNEVTYNMRYEYWVLRLYDAAPEAFRGIAVSPRSVSGFPEYIIEFLRCPGCGTPIAEFVMSISRPARNGDAFVYLSRCGCGKTVTVENYIDYGEEIPWPDNSGKIVT